MTSFEFSVAGVNAELRGVAPAVDFHMEVRAKGEPVDAIALRVRVQIEPALRGYDDDERTLLAELFGDGLRSLPILQWYEGSVTIGRFADATAFDLTVPCTYDMHVATAAYFGALHDGDVPLRFFFNGTVFRGAPSGFHVEMLPWNLECAARLPLQTWQAAMDARFPDQAWIRIPRATYEALRRYRAEQKLADWETTFGSLLGVRT